VLIIVAVEFWKGTRARARIEGESRPIAFFHLVSRNRRRWGGYIVHVGIVLIFGGIAGASYNQDVRQHLMPGDTMDVASPWGHTYHLTYEGLSTSIGRGQRNLDWQAIALISVRKGDKSLGNMTTEKRKYTTADQTMTEVGIRTSPQEDLYLILSAVDDLNGVLGNNANAQGIDLQVLVKPLLSWIWWGGLVLVVGSIIALWPSAERRRDLEEEKSKEEAVTVGAA
jgi:cytochrome c-type biogenesis protein CcmF